VHVVDDDASIRRALTRLLQARGYTVQSYESAELFIERRAAGPGCMVLDLQLPERSGLELLEQLAVSDRELSVVILSGHADVATAVSAMKLGAVDVLNKPVEDTRLTATVAAACERSTAAWSDREEKRALQQRFDTLTARERDIAWLVGRGLLNKQIAYDLGLSEKTVKAHRGNVTRKLQVNSVAELVRLLDRLGVKTPPGIAASE
jgi:FixJ family two-component response regulator